MSVKHRQDSIKDSAKKITPEDLAAENEQLQNQVTNLQLALCEMYEAVTGGVK